MLKNSIDRVDDGVEYEDPDSLGFRNSSVGIKEIALEQFRVCLKEGSKEMTYGGSREILVNGRVKKILVANQAQIFCNAVQLLYITLLPEINKNDNQMAPYKKRIKESENEFNNWFNNQKHMLARLKKNPATRKLYPSKVEDTRVERDKKLVELHQLKLKQLSTLLNHLNYFNEIFGSIN